MLAKTGKHAYYTGMRKQDLILIAGGTVKLAKLIGISSQAMSMWPEVLPTRKRNEVVGAFVVAGRFAEIRHLLEDLDEAA